MFATYLVSATAIIVAALSLAGLVTAVRHFDPPDGPRAR